MEVLFFIVLYSSIAFESVMIGYQVAVNPEPCLFCMGVYGGLLSIALLSNRGYFAYALPVIASIFLAFGDLAIAKNESLIEGDGIYLVHSERCPHCKRVKNIGLATGSILPLVRVCAKKVSAIDLLYFRGFEIGFKNGTQVTN
jgi:hypothetical protein